MVSMKPIEKVIVGVITVIVIITLAAGLVPELTDATEEYTDAGTCADAGGWYNETSEACQVSQSNQTALAYDATPFGGLVNTVVIMLVMVFILLLVIRYSMKTGGMKG